MFLHSLFLLWPANINLRMFLCRNTQILFSTKIYHFHFIVILTRHIETLSHAISLSTIYSPTQAIHYNQPILISQSIHHMSQSILKFFFFLIYVYFYMPSSHTHIFTLSNLNFTREIHELTHPHPVITWCHSFFHSSKQPTLLYLRQHNLCLNVCHSLLPRKTPFFFLN